MKKTFSTIILLLSVVTASHSTPRPLREGQGEGPLFQSHHILQINREPARAWFMPFQKSVGDRQMSLNGTWKFHWSPTPEGKITGFEAADFNDSSWKTLAVPANWEVNGYGTPIYSSSGYTFKINPPYVMDEPKAGYTAVIERNPTGQYRRSFTLPEEWEKDGATYLRFDGAWSAFNVWINGKHAGYSQGSNEAAEFNITPLLHAGANSIAVEVYKYSDGSYLEDQDAWRFGGIHRDVTLFHTPTLRLRDFTLRTVAANESFTDFRLQINPRLQSLDGNDAHGYSIRAILTDNEGKEVATLNTDAEPVLDLAHKAAVMNEWFPQRGRMKFERMDTLLHNVNTWTAETPYLYNLTLQLVNPDGIVTEQAQQHVGFRHLEIRNGMFLVNGKQVRFRGVNRVEHDPLTARYLSEERMLQDLRLMKAANINAVRTAHSPADPRWYDLCDSIGIYVLDEANCENHGVRGEFTSTPDWNEAMMDRVIRMAERDKNHPSVVFWSLGNESGYGANHSAMAGWLHEFDETRFVHYEGAQGSVGGTEETPDPLCVDVISRFYPRVMQEYLNPGVPEGSDKERAENARWEHLLGIAQRQWKFKGGYMDGVIDNRPVLTSEYAHCMGNALGNFQEYWDEIYSNPRMLGGFIWDWVDQGLTPLNPPSRENLSNSITDFPLEGGTRAVLYGGDFGDKPNLKAFCLNGVVKCDRSVTSKYYEVQHVYSPVQFAKHGNDIYVINRNHHIGLDGYKITATVLNNGKASKPFSVALPSVQPGDSAIVNINNIKAKGHTLLNLTVTENGKKVSDEQLHIAGTPFDIATTPPLKGEAGRGLPFFFRAPTDNDKSFGNWLAKDWTKNRIDSPSVAHIATRQEGTTTVEIDEYSFDNGIVKMGGKVVVETRTTPLAGGGTDIIMEFECKGDMPELPRLGMMIELPKEYNKLTYYGRGPWDTYPDRWQSCHFGMWKSTVDAEYAHFPVPQDCGNHKDCSYVELTSSNKKSIKVYAVEDAEAENNGLFTFSALRYTPQEIAAYRHDFELMEAEKQGIVGNHTILTIDCAVLGIGNSSCGPGVLKKYSIDRNKKHRLHVVMSK